MKKGMMILGLATVAASAFGDGMTTTDCTVRFRVVDEAGHPVSNAYVRGMSDWAGARQNGLTDTNGVFAYRDRVYSEVGCTVVKEGYYRSQGDVWHWNGAGTYPTNTLTVVLKRIVDPVPMLYRKVETHLPRLGEPVGFDLAEGDWVAPDGRGAVADVWMTGKMRFVSRDDHNIEVRLRFSNRLEGLREFRAVDPDDLRMASDLMPPQLAPPHGYSGSLDLWQTSEPDGPFREHDESDRSYLFRVRTKVDEEGRVVEAKHGWTYGEIAVDSEDGKRIWMRLRYYYNPDPQSRSLEPREIADRQGR